MNNITFGELLKFYRQKRNMRQLDLSIQANIGLGTIKDHENNRSKPRLWVLKAYANVFNVPVWVFIDVSEDTFNA